VSDSDRNLFLSGAFRSFPTKILRRQPDSGIILQSAESSLCDEVAMVDGTRLPTTDELIEQHSALLYRYAYRLSGNASDAEDLVQQTYMLVHQRLHQLRDTKAARGWLVSIVRNVFLKSLRNLHVGRSLDDIDEPQVEGTPETPVHLERLQEALLELSEEFRSPLVLYYFEDFSYQEIATQMGVPIGTVMSRISRGKAYLRKRLTDEPAKEQVAVPAANRLKELALKH
jgi:RNA polymerase sigma-70 factor (ECF subfamily)